MKQRDMDALQRDFSCLNKADFARLVTEVDAAPTSYARCNVIAAWRKRTHDLREAAIVQAHAVDGVLYGWSEIVEPVTAVERVQPTWWCVSALWDTGIAHHSIVEYKAFRAIRASVGVHTVKDTVKRVVQELYDEALSEEWPDVRGAVALREIKRGMSHEQARQSLNQAA